MIKVEILESHGGFDSELKQTFAYQKGDVVIMSKTRYEGIKAFCKVLTGKTKPEKRPDKSRKETR